MGASTKADIKRKADIKQKANGSSQPKTVLILASQSTARRRLLKRLGLRFRVQPAHLDEDAIARKIRDPKALVAQLSRLKARFVFEKAAQSSHKTIVIGSDQVLVCGNRIFGKPHTVEKACQQLSLFSGKTIRLYTAVTVLTSQAEQCFVHVTKMKFRNLKPEEVRAYVEKDLPLDCAGSFKFESYGIQLFESVTTDDPTAIEGLPLLKLAALLRKTVKA